MQHHHATSSSPGVLIYKHLMLSADVACAVLIGCHKLGIVCKHLHLMSNHDMVTKYCPLEKSGGKATVFL